MEEEDDDDLCDVNTPEWSYPNDEMEDLSTYYYP